MGPQKIYSDLVWEGPTAGTPISPVAANSAALPAVFGYLAGSPNHGRYWNSRFETTGDSLIDRDNGYSATLTFSLNGIWIARSATTIVSV